MDRLVTFALLSALWLIGCPGVEPQAPGSGVGAGSGSGGATTGGSSSGGSGGDGADAGPNQGVDAGLPAPAIFCTPPQLDFGWNAFGIASTLSVLCTNIGQSETDLFIPDPKSGDQGLSIQNGDLAFQAAFAEPFPASGLKAGESTTINVTYAPTAPGSDSDTLIISSNDPVNPRTAIALTGSAIALPPCEFSVSPQSVALGDIPVGTAETFTLTIANIGEGECLLGPIRLGNFRAADGGAFSLPDYPPGSHNYVTIAPGQSLELAICVTLEQPGPWEGEIDFGGSFKPTSVPVSAYGVQ